MSKQLKDSRFAAFCSREMPEIFHSICHRHEIFRDDPLDVTAIHSEARDVFERLLHQATTPPGLPSGRILLLKGEAGSGKTHLMRAFRSTVHSSGIGYFGYMQMTSSASSYADYMLSNLITSLDQPYEAGSVSGLMRLSNALAENPEAVPPEMLEILRNGEGHAGAPARFVNVLSDHVVKQERFRELDLDLVRILLYLQLGDPRIKSRALAWVRCEDLSSHDRASLGDIVPRTKSEDSQRMFEQLGRAMWTLQGSVLVVCIDQLEDMVHSDQVREKFQRAMSALCALADRVPSSVFVISCLEDYYQGLRQYLAASLRDRIEKDPEPLVLESGRTAKEVDALIETRLKHLYVQLDTPFYAKDPLYPFTPEQVRRWTHQRTRDVLDACRAIRDQAVLSGEMPAAARGQEQTLARVSVAPSGGEQEVLQWEQRWNDFSAAWQTQKMEASADLAKVLAEAIRECGAELESGHRFEGTAHGSYVSVKVLGRAGKVMGELFVGVCNAGTQGGGLSREVAAVQKEAGKRTPVLVRSTVYPSSARSKVSQLLGEFVTGGGRRVVVEESDWRAMQAMSAFRAQHGSQPHFDTWAAAENPLSRLQGLRQVLDLDHLIPLEEEAPVAKVHPPAPQVVAAVHPIASATGIRLGRGSDLRGEELLMEPGILTQHAAFLGGSGSGKTTLAMRIIEQLLAKGIPAILIDRKGDLCTYAKADAWISGDAYPAEAARRAELRSRLDVRVFTPGNPAGGSLAIPLAPRGLSQLAGHERDQVSTYAASALGGMLGYKTVGRDKSYVAILSKAISLLTELKRDITLDNLLSIVGTQDAHLVNAVGLLDPKLFKRLGEDLQTLKLTGGALVDDKGPPVDIDALFGRGADALPGKTRLSVISTKFLGDNGNVLFFVAQLLLEMSRWSSKNPSKALQGVLMMDEADLYLPAVGKPSTKEPMENLLKRARSAGLSIMLATQSPGDLDYRCRDTIRSWFVGRVKEQTALNKMKPMLNDCRDNVAGKIPSQGTGAFFLLQNGSASGFKADRSLIDAQQVPEDEILLLAKEKSGQGDFPARTTG